MHGARGTMPELPYQDSSLHHQGAILDATVDPVGGFWCVIIMKGRTDRSVI